MLTTDYSLFADNNLGSQLSLSSAIANHSLLLQCFLLSISLTTKPGVKLWNLTQTEKRFFGLKYVFEEKTHTATLNLIAAALSRK